MNNNSKKWAALVASAWIQCFAGAYTFSLYSPVLKSSQHYNQTAIGLVSLFREFGNCFGIPVGLLTSSSVAARRPWIVLTVGAIVGFSGYFPVWLAVNGAVRRPPVSLMCFYMFLTGHAITFYDTVNVVTAVGNFSQSRGIVVGIMKSFLGLSGAVLTHIYQTLLNRDQTNFILLLALLPNILTLLLMPLVKVYPGPQTSNQSDFNSMSIISLTIAGYLLFTTLTEHITTMTSTANYIVLTLLLLLVVSPTAIVVKIHITESNTSTQSHSSESLTLLHEEENRQRNTGKENAEENRPKLSTTESSNLLQAMTKLNFWLFFLSIGCSIGSGAALFYNMSQIGGSIGYTNLQTSSLVSLWSIWNFLGRFGIGYVSDYFLKVKGCARPLFVAVTLAVMSLGHSVVSSGLPGSLYVGSVLVGVCFGSQWALLPSITSEIFGLRHFGTIYNTIAIAGPLGSYFLSVKVVAYIYDIESLASSSSSGSCVGRRCFRLSFLIMACVCLVGVVLALVLWYRTI